MPGATRQSHGLAGGNPDENDGSVSDESMLVSESEQSERVSSRQSRQNQNMLCNNDSSRIRRANDSSGSEAEDIHRDVDMSG